MRGPECNGRAGKFSAGGVCGKVFGAPWGRERSGRRRLRGGHRRSKSEGQKGISIGFVKLGRRPIRSDDPKASQYGTSPSGTFRPLSVLVPLHIKSGLIAHCLAGSEDTRHVP